MGSELGGIFHSLWNECAWLHMRWAQYVEVFGSKPEHFEVMNSVAPGFFKAAQDSMWEGILLHLCRLTESQPTYKQTLCLDQLTRFGSYFTDIPIKELVHSAKRSTSFARDLRNRRLAHRELPGIEESEKPLEFASRSKVRIALKAIVSTLNPIQMHFMESTTIFDAEPYRQGGGLYLLQSLRLVEVLRNERKERMLSGRQRDDDEDWTKWRGL